MYRSTYVQEITGRGRKSQTITFTMNFLHLKEINFNDYMIKKSFLNSKKEVRLLVMFV